MRQTSPLSPLVWASPAALCSLVRTNYEINRTPLELNIYHTIWGSKNITKDSKALSLTPTGAVNVVGNCILWLINTGVCALPPQEMGHGTVVWCRVCGLAVKPGCILWTMATPVMSNKPTSERSPPSSSNTTSWLSAAG